ncbi:MAG: dTDP-glucose 4,6-dehydratase [Candidatus Niyogibacteria bacterium]|nr:dTDP-glucose 4,6-dehydratase [Candidatus Niyogibacteria bacterium]
MEKEFKKFFKNKTFLVCGGCGFMGSNFIHYVARNFNEAKIINLDLLTYAGNKDNLSGIKRTGYKFIRGDICDVALVKKLMRDADFVINFAAETHVDRSVHSAADDFIRTNILGVHSLIKALQSSVGVSKMVHISTDEVWGDLPLKSKAKFNEDSAIRPNSPYAASKAAGDALIRAYVKTHGLPVIVSHSVNNFGPRQFPEKLIPFFVLRAMRDKPLPLYGDGKNVRDWIYVDDHTTAILTILYRAQAGDIYAISRDEECSNIEIADKILKILQKPKTLITFVKDRPGHDRRYSVDSSRLKRLGWKPRYSLDSQIVETIKWYEENKLWVNNIIKKSSGINTHLSV